MIGWLLVLWVGLARAGDTWVVAPGETLDEVARALGDPALAPEIARINQLDPRAPLTPGQVLTLPASADVVGAEVLAAQGEVLVNLSGQIAVPAEPGRRLQAGATVCTGPDGLASLRLATVGVNGQHDDVTLLHDTCLTVERASRSASRRVSLLTIKRGSVTVRPSEDGPGTVTVRTPSGITTGDLGGFRVSLEAGAARTEAVEQPVSVLGAGAEVKVAAGEGTRVRDGQVPDAPTPLLRAGPLVAPPDATPLFRPEFSWVAVDRALAYRVEVSATASFDNLVLVETVDEESWAPERLLLPFRVDGLWWRVSPIDRTGFVGLPSRARGLTLPSGIGP